MNGGTTVHLNTSDWTKAIETLGLENEENVRAKVQFEVLTKKDFS